MGLLPADVAQLIFESSTDCVWVIDPNGGHLYTNGAVERILGYAPTEFEGTTVMSVLHPDDQERLTQLLEHAVTMRTSWRNEIFRVRAADGTYRWFESNGGPMYDEAGSLIGFCGADRDITDRNRMLNEIRESELRFRSIVQHGYDLIAVCDARGIVQFAAGAFEKNLGYTAEELQGMDIVKLAAEEERSEIYTVLASVVTSKDRPRTTRIVGLGTKSGALRRYEATSVNMLEVVGVHGIVIIARDVTEQLALEESIERVRRVDSLGRVAATVAHEINNALMTIQPAAEALARKSADDAQLSRLTDIVISGVRRGKRVTQQILRFANPAIPSRSRVSLKKWLDANDAELRSLAGSKVNLTIRCTDASLAIDADVDQLHQVITNLIVNARDAMRGGGAIELIVSAVATSAMVEISVGDNGPGIPAEVLPRIFEPLFTTKSSGTGIGLALCEQIVTVHGGSIKVDSAIGRGTVVSTRFPAAA
jgi:PAS domain S-box-containing protein